MSAHRAGAGKARRTAAPKGGEIAIELNAAAREPGDDTDETHIDPRIAELSALLNQPPGDKPEEHLIALDAASESMAAAHRAREAGEAPLRARDCANAMLAAAMKDPSRMGDAAAAVAQFVEADRIARGITSELVLGARPVVGSNVFAPLPPVPWLVKDLQWAPGRPNQIQGYGGAGKSFAVMSAALAIITERPVWDRFLTGHEHKRVIHIDYDQGKRATPRRYQRLALGMGIDPREVADRLVIVPRPPLRLTSFDIGNGAGRQEAIDTFCRAVDGYDLGIIDALRGVLAGVDENDSRIRDYLDILGDVSEKTGCALVFLHHTGKSSRGGTHRPDVEQGRGSSAIQDGSGSVILMEAHSRLASVVSVKVTRDSADREGPRVEPHYLEILDVEHDGDPTAGLRVVHRSAVDIDGEPANKVDDKRRDLMRTILRAVRKAPGATVGAVKGIVGGNGRAVSEAIDALQSPALGPALLDRPQPGAKTGAKALFLADGFDPDTFEPPAVAARRAGKCGRMLPCDKCAGSGTWREGHRSGRCTACAGAGKRLPGQKWIATGTPGYEVLTDDGERSRDE